MVFQSTTALVTKPRALSWSSWPLSVRLPYFAAPAIADGPNHAAAIGRVVDIVEQVEGLVDASEFHDGACQAGGALASQERAHQFRSLHGAEPERAGDPQHVVPVLLDAPGPGLVTGDVTQGAVVGMRVQSVESGFAGIGEARGELIAEQPEQAEDQITGAGAFLPSTPCQMQGDLS